MRILVVAPTPFFSDRGTHIRILEEALALEELGHEITIATYHIGKDIDRRIDTKIDVRRIRRLLFWYKKLEAGPDWQKIILDLMLIRKTFFLARTKRPDIIHGHLHEGVIIGWIVQKLLFWRKMKLVADFHGSLTGEMLSHGYLKRGLKSIFSFIENIINKMGDWAITSSWECTEKIKKSRRDEKVETVLDGINLDSFNIKKAKEEIRRDWEIPENKVIIGYSGAFVANKGIQYLFSAMALIAKEKSDAYFLVGGFPAEHAQKLIKENNLEKSTRLIVPLDYFKLPEFLSIFDIAVDPKGTDTGQASGKMLNYMAAGLPIVCFDKSNNRKYLGEGGIYAQKENAESLAQKILELINNQDLRIEKGRINKENSLKFSWVVPAGRISEIYNKITKN
ncbi:MAG: glycosyltransferase family 4 protein [Parcubacteria group bacterium]|jgi:glycosyltransferase involved in cell wall biosynthesis